MSNCPCGSGQILEACCGLYHAGTPAPTAEALMRSRYTAFTLGNGAYLAKTLSTQQRSDFNIEEFEASAANTKWQGLDIRQTSDGGEKDETGTVEFVAKYREGTQQAIHHELAMFKREEGNWVFADCQMNPKGEQRVVEKVGRNDPCPCGSGKKHKKCCGA
ncbi:MAG: YchJ family protein [Rhodospirillales bacterium]|nr:YchJ family protein [Rhodospirillales bacterium]